MKSADENGWRNSMVGADGYDFLALREMFWHEKGTCWLCDLEREAYERLGPDEFLKVHDAVYSAPPLESGG